MELASLENTFAALEQYKEGSGRGALIPLDEAVVSALASPAEKDQLEKRLAGLLGSNISPVAKEYVCRKLIMVGSARSVPALAGLLDDESLSEAARTTLQAISCPEAHTALRESLGKVADQRKAGLISSIGVSRDAESVSALAPLLDSSDRAIASAAAAALGEIGTLEAAGALGRIQSKAPPELLSSVADARLVCAERLVSAGAKPQALAIYQSLNDAKFSPQVQLAAKRGLLQAMRRKG